MTSLEELLIGVDKSVGGVEDVDFDNKMPKFDKKTEEARAQHIKNNNMISDQEMKKSSLATLFKFLSRETVAIFILVYLQGFGKMLGFFYIEEWCFSILTTVTLAQIASMLLIAIKHLFPKQHTK